MTPDESVPRGYRLDDAAIPKSFTQALKDGDVVLVDGVPHVWRRAQPMDLIDRVATNLLAEKVRR